MKDAPPREDGFDSPERLHNILESHYRDAYPRMVRFATARLGDPDAAQDAVNDTFVSALRNVDGLREWDSLDAWLWSILVNHTRMERRRRRWFTGTAPDLSMVAATDAPIVDRELRRIVRQLPTRQRTVLFLRYYGDLPNTTIAEVLGISTGTVGATIHQAQRALRQILEEGTN